MLFGMDVSINGNPLGISALSHIRSVSLLLTCTRNPEKKDNEKPFKGVIPKIST